MNPAGREGRVGPGDHGAVSYASVSICYFGGAMAAPEIGGYGSMKKVMEEVQGEKDEVP